MVTAILGVCAGCGKSKVAITEFSGDVSIADVKIKGGYTIHSGDKIVVDDGKLSLLMENEKHIYVAHDTVMYVYTEEENNPSGTEVRIDKGSVVFDNKNTLSEGETYNVITPNVTLPIGKNSMIVYVEMQPDGTTITKVNVVDGVVLARTIEDGKEVTKKINIERVVTFEGRSSDER